ncbi:NADP-dependent oxidoreductase [Lapidilactobacillus bayanensis]|uniref:NADP-dependent oxidoreductase n=1 Tax=Lapidilactobacillus bayanensis TaxID=2485998 RepID=UPI000F776727|nr:NADP-dependent oxidoreductase [Lapidilactobacillus bayanensis]
MTETMQALVAQNSKVTPKFRRVPLPIMAAEQVLIKVAAVSINPVDQIYRTIDLFYADHFQYPLILGNDLAGTVVAVGKNVTKFKIGDHVYGRIGHLEGGTFAKYSAVAASNLAHAPQNNSLAEAAAIPLVGLTAYQIIHVRLAAKPGQKLFINGGSGGVGTMAIQIARILGLEVATTASTKNSLLLQQLGANTVIDYQHQDFTKTLRDYDGFLDTRRETNLTTALQILKPGGQYLTLNNMPQPSFADQQHLGVFKKAAFAVVSAKNRRIARRQKISYEFYLMHESGAQLQQLTEWLEAGQLRPVIDRTYSFAELPAALAYSKQGHTVGKVVVTMN